MGTTGRIIMVWIAGTIAGLAACGSDETTPASAGGTSGDPPGTSSSSGGTTSGSPPVADDRPPAGNPTGKAEIPPEGRLEDVSSPRTVVGTGTPESCTGDAFVDAVAKGGVITFDCGANPVTITLTKTAKIFNDKGPKIVIDGGGKITLSGGGKVRILYQSTCDKAQVWTSGNCNHATEPQLTVQNITFEGGSAKDVVDGENKGGGGAIYAQGGRLKVINARFFSNVCAELGSDVGGGAIRKLDYLVEIPGEGPRRPVWVVNSTFGGRADLGNSCANGGALSSIGVSWNILNTLLSDNRATGHGANKGEGGNGGAIYNDGNEIVLDVASSVIRDNKANEGGSAIFFVSNDKSGSITIRDSTTQNNPRGTFETPDLPGFYVIAKGPAQIVNSQILR